MGHRASAELQAWITRAHEILGHFLMPCPLIRWRSFPTSEICPARKDTHDIDGYPSEADIRKLTGHVSTHLFHCRYPYQPGRRIFFRHQRWASSNAGRTIACLFSVVGSALRWLTISSILGWTGSLGGSQNRPDGAIALLMSCRGVSYCPQHQIRCGDHKTLSGIIS